MQAITAPEYDTHARLRSRPFKLPPAFTETDYADIDVKHTVVGTAGGNDPDTGDIYRGLDRFGRVKDCYWYDYGSSTDVLHIKHGYDRAGNRLYREEADTSDLDQLYSYNDVNRLTQSQEGTLGAGKDSISSLNFAQQWSLDATGNWSGFKEDDDGDSTWDLDQTRTSNAVNEITDVSETTGPSWLTPAYNRAGNMTTIPQPGDPTQSYTATYDAWNRLVKLEDSQDTVAEYIFDGAKRFVIRKKYVSGSLNQTRHFYHTAQWQTIEERLETGGQITSTADRQFTWGLRYIDDLVCRTTNSTHDYAYQDANWNVILSSSALSRVGYEAYGQIRSTCTAASGDPDDWQHYFAGYRRDEDTGLYLVRHRVYQPELGCWVRRDPIGYAAGDENLYGYVHGSPTNATDSSGLNPVIKWIVQKVIKGLIGDLNPNGGIGGGDRVFCSCRYRSRTQIEVFVALNTADASDLEYLYSYNGDGEPLSFGLPPANVRFISFRIAGARPTKERCDEAVERGADARVHLDKRRKTGTVVQLPLEPDGKKNDLLRIDVVTWWVYAG